MEHQNTLDKAIFGASDVHVSGMGILIPSKHLVLGEAPNPPTLRLSSRDSTLTRRCLGSSLYGILLSSRVGGRPLYY